MTDDDNKLIEAVSDLYAISASCWDCWYFKNPNVGLCCPIHGTPEEKKAADLKVRKQFILGRMWMERIDGD